MTDALTGLGNRRRLFRDLYERLERDTEPFLLALFDLDGFKAHNDSFGHPAGDLLLQRVSASLAAAVAPVGSAYRLGGDEFCVMVAPGIGGAEQALAPAQEALTEVGAGFTVGASFGSVSLPAETRDPDEAKRRADRRMYSSKGSRTNAADQQTRSVLLRVLEERAPSLSEHLVGVASLALAVGRRMGFTADDLDVLARAAEMHDVGKVAIPDDVLYKPRPLDELEWELMRTHTIIGERILSAAPALAEVAAIVRSTHERWDGGGYPDGLAAEEIPVSARVISICDAFDAMTQDRPYRSPRSQGAALAELRNCAGSQFDPTIVEYVCEEMSRSGHGSYTEAPGVQAPLTKSAITSGSGAPS